MDSHELEPLAAAENISGEWIQKMLFQKYRNHINVHSWSYEVPDGREGFLSEIAFLKVSYSTGDSKISDLHLVLKVLPKDPSLRQFMSNGGLAKREVGFYSFINSPEFKQKCYKNGLILPVAEMYYSCYTEDAITIVLQDLKVFGYKSIIVRDGSSVAQTKVALNAIAQIHAAGFVYLEECDQINRNIFQFYEFNPDFYDQFLGPNLNTLVEMTEGTLLSQAIKSLLPISKSLLTLPNRYKFIKTVIHGDLWAGQLLYSNDETNARVIDWQFCRIDNPVTDIISMIFMSCNPKVLEPHLDELFCSYWDHLTESVGVYGKTLGVTYEQFLKNIEDLWIYGFAFLVISIHDFMSADNISRDRIFGAIEFLEKRGVFSDFIKLIGNDGCGDKYT